MLKFFNNYTDVQNLAMEWGFAYYHSQYTVKKGHNLSGRAKVMACISIQCRSESFPGLLCHDIESDLHLHGSIADGWPSRKEWKRITCLIHQLRKNPLLSKHHNGNMTWELGQLVYIVKNTRFFGQCCTWIGASSQEDAVIFQGRYNAISLILPAKCTSWLTMEPPAPPFNVVMQTISINGTSFLNITTDSSTACHLALTQRKILTGFSQHPGSNTDQEYKQMHCLECSHQYCHSLLCTGICWSADKW